jgi:hypothetical protein
VRTRHANYFAELAERADPELRGPGQLEWMYRLDAAEDNLRAALDWALATDDAGCALRLCNGLGWYSMMRGKQFGRNQTPKVIELADRLGLPHDATYLRVLTFNALYAFELGVPPEEATAQLNLAREQARAGEWRDSLYSLAEIGAALFTAPETIESVFEVEYVRLAGHGDEWGLAATRMFHAKVIMDEPELAETLTEQALDCFQRLGDHWGIANCGQTMAMLESQRGAHHEALAAIEAVLPVTRLIGSSSDEVMLLLMAVNEYTSLGEPENARRTLEQAHAVSRARPDNHASVYLMTAECVRARRNGRLDQAQAWLDEVGRAAGQAFLGPVKALLATQQAWISLARRDFEETARLLRQGFEHAIAFHYDRPDIGAVIEARAALDLALGDARRAAWLHGLFAVVRGRELPLTVTPDLAETADAARAAIGDEAYGAAYSEGRAVDPATVLRTCCEVFGADPDALPGWWSQRRDQNTQT